ncbi:MAG: class I SAM-dependent methyltransferase [Opitutaceae bacterium]
MNYSPLANYYRAIEIFTMGTVLQSARIAQVERLAEVSTIQNALLVGEGDGSFLIHFMQRFPEAQITVIEHSEFMILRAKERLLKADCCPSRVTFVRVGLLDADFDHQQFDLITTIFFLDNFGDETVKECLAHLMPCLREGGHWIVSDFAIPQSGWRRWRAKLWLNILYVFFRQTAAIPARHLPAIEQHFGVYPLRLNQRQEFSAGLLFSSLYRRIR